MTEIFLERFAVNGLNLINCMIAEPRYNRCEFSESWQLTGMMVREGGPFITTAAPPVGVGVCKKLNIFHTHFNDKNKPDHS